MVRAAKQSTNLAAKRTARVPLPTFIEPQLSKLVEHAPTGPNWVHEIKFDGYRMAARIERGRVKLLTRSGLDWSEKYPETVQALSKLSLETAYIEGELRRMEAEESAAKRGTENAAQRLQKFKELTERMDTNRFTGAVLSSELPMLA
jgi:ATP-dependent DNA ligase